MKQTNNSLNRMSNGMMILAWLSFFLVMGLYFHDDLLQREQPNRELSFEAKQELVLIRNHRGHYVAPGRINGVEVQFLVDSGATWVSIPEAIADKAGLKRGPVSWVNTANGRIRTYQTKVEELSVAGLTQTQVRALINPSDQQDLVLLGMNFL